MVIRRDVHVPAEQRMADLLGPMTPGEKAAQLMRNLDGDE
jgi:hypothetical protein